MNRRFPMQPRPGGRNRDPGPTAAGIAAPTRRLPKSRAKAAAAPCGQRDTAHLIEDRSSQVRARRILDRATRRGRDHGQLTQLPPRIIGVGHRLQPGRRRLPGRRAMTRPQLIDHDGEAEPVGQHRGGDAGDGVPRAEATTGPGVARGRIQPKPLTSLAGQPHVDRVHQLPWTPLCQPEQIVESGRDFPRHASPPISLHGTVAGPVAAQAIAGATRPRVHDVHEQVSTLPALLVRADRPARVPIVTTRRCWPGRRTVAGRPCGSAGARPAARSTRSAP